MAALPYIQLYVADYLADTHHLTTEEHGAYLLLIFSYWQTGKPLKVNRLASAARMSNERWTSVEHTLKEFFEVADDLWVHLRVERDLEKVATKSGKNSEAGKASAAARAFAKQQLERRARELESTNVERTLNERLTIEDTDTDTDTHKDKDQKPLSPDSDVESVAKAPKLKYRQIQEAYNEICPPTLPACAVMNEKRKRQIKAMCEIEFMGSKPFRNGIEVWRQYFTDCLTNKHWCGVNDREWKANFDFVTKPDNAIKLMERMN